MSTQYGQPLRPEVGIVALVPDHWNPLWETRHFVLSRLARYFRVVWVDYPHGWRDILKLRRDSPEFYPAPPAGLQIYRPEAWLPLIGRPQWIAEGTSRERLKRARSLLHAQHCSKLVVYIWRPEFASALHQAEWDLSIYHIDDEYSFSPTETQISPQEKTLLKSAGQVFIHSPALMEKKGKFNPNTEYVPNGVDYHAYATPAPEPADLRDVPHPRIGYVGYLKQALDWQLLLQLSSLKPKWSFVFVGAARPHPEITIALQQISTRPNVYFLGSKETEKLGAYPQHFAVCVMPYKMNDYTKYIYPLKIHEYLASGRPVISTPIRSVEAFRSVITLAKGARQWSVAVNDALSKKENSQARRQQRQAVAHEHDWNVLVFRLARKIAERLNLTFVEHAERREAG